MAFHSILFESARNEPGPDTSEPPAFFHDLNLDQLIARITAGYEQYALAPFYYGCLSDLDAIAYRQEIMQELTGRFCSPTSRSSST